MPCAEGELCLQQDRTPEDSHGHVCQGGCGGRLHGNCGSVFDDIETHRICSTCVTRIGKRKAAAANGAGAGPSKRQKDKSGGSKKGGVRARPDNNTKLEILKLLDAKVAQVQNAERFGCSERFGRTVKADRKKVEAATAAGGGTQKTARKGDFPEVDAIALYLLAKARKAKVPVTRDVLRSFGRSARTTLLADTATSAAVRARWKLLPRRTYLSTSEDRKTARGPKSMYFKDRLAAIMCCNAGGTAKVDMAIIGKAKEPRCFKDGGSPLKYFSQANAWSDSATFLKWWLEVFLPFVRRFTHEPVLLMMDGCSSHGDLVDDRFSRKHGPASPPRISPGEALTETVNKMSTSVGDAHEQRVGTVDDEISEFFAELDIEPGKPVEGEAVSAIQGWGTLEDDDEVAEALRLDAVDEMAALLAGTQVTTGGEEEDEEEGSGDDNTGPERRAPPAYDELSPHFSVQEAAADESGNGDAAFFLTKAKMVMIAAHSAERVRQADMREFVAPTEQG
ncbi:unnamed protein product [Ectocarpus sp. CCAP 1310/34]|nr:unnamed protein product [Ectocarpus sp. CCAP 1310/34]